MKEILSAREGKIKARTGGGWFLIDRVTVELEGKLIDWWKVFYWGGGAAGFSHPEIFVSHAPTKELAIKQAEELNKPDCPYTHLRFEFKE